MAPGVINKNALTYKSKNKFDLILAISTFEHIGKDEIKKYPTKIIKVINNLKKQLNKNGKIIFSVPIGYNNDLDKIIQDNQLAINVETYLERNSKINTWINTNKKSAFKRKYNSPYPNANAIMIGEIKAYR